MDFSIKHEKRLSRLFIYAVAYQSDADINTDVKKWVRTQAENLAKKDGFKNGWQGLGTYDQIEKWYIENYINTTNQ